ncbi:MAG: hypothetical protein JHC82_14005 [Stenotrophomonas sp.]|nr:hypothetical protein [Stenotrophomonas sp.]
MSTRFRPVRIRTQLHLTLRLPLRQPADDGVPRCTLAFRASAPADWWLTRMLLQSNELDRLIGDLQHQQYLLPDDATQPWQRPGWLEASLPLGLARGEYDAMIQALSARRADLRRTYLPLMTAMSAGTPVPLAVAAIIVC